MARRGNPNLKAGPGRPKGSKDKKTAKIRKMITDLVDQGLEGFAADLQKLTPAQRIKALTELVPYVAPKLKQVDMTVTDESEKTVIVINNPYNPNETDKPDAETDG